MQTFKHTKNVAQEVSIVMFNPRALATSVGYSFAFAALCSLAIMPQAAIAEETTDDNASGEAANESTGTRVYNAPVASQKYETVYVYTNPTGKVKSTEVSTTLKNPLGEQQLADSSTLTEISNGGSDKFFTGSGDAMIWDTLGGDVEYTGTTMKKAPVSVKVTYKLNGKKVKPKDLAGASGKLTIRCDYKNQATVKTQIKGEEETLYVPFTFITAMLFDGDTIKDIEVTNGKIIEDGDNAIVAGYAIPGLTKNLGDIAKEFNIPDYFEVSGVINNFSMKPSMTIATAGLMEEFKTDDVDTAKLGESSKELTDAMDKIMKGTDDLKKGLQKLADGAKSAKVASGQLANNAADLADANADLYESLATVKDDSTDLPGGMQALAEGSGALAEGLPSAAEGAEALEKDAGSLGEGAGALGEGAGKLGEGLSSLKGGMDSAASDGETLKETADELNTGLAELVDGNDPEDENDKVYGLKDAKKQAEDVASELKQLTEIVSDNGNLPAATEALQTVTTSLADDEESIAASAANANQSIVELNELLETYKDQLGDDYDTILALSNQVSDQVSEIYTNAKSYSDDLAGASDGLAGVDKIVGEATDNINELNDKLDIAAKNAQALSDTSETVKNGVASMNDSIQTTAKGIEDAATSANDLQTNASDLQEGAGKLESGASELKGSKDDGTGLYGAAEGASQISTNLQTLSATVPSVIAGIDAVVSGAGEVADSSDTLAEKMFEYDDAMKTLEKGTDTAMKSTDELTEGMKTFSEEGLKGISDLIDEDLLPFTDRLDAITAAAKHYNNFSGITEGTEGSVKFIIETEAF